MKKPRKKFAVCAIVLSAVFCAVQLTASTYAWLINFVTGGNFGYTANELPPYALEIARIPYSETGRAETNRTYSECKNYKIETNDDGTHLAANLTNMTFGTIDNVAQLKPENIVYLRLTVPKESGDTLKLNFHYKQENFISLYQKTVDADGNEGAPQEVTEESVLTALLNVDKSSGAETSSGDAYLLYDAAVSDIAYDANRIAENIPFAQNEADYQRFGTSQTAFKTLTNENYDKEKDYYIYIKVIPNLSVFAYSIEYLSAVMPCYMYFNIGAIFDSANSEKTI